MKLISINIGKAREHQLRDRVEITGIYKLPVREPVGIKSLGIESDAVCDTKNHGGPDQAIYVYGVLDYAWWSNELARDIAPGTFGENFTISELECTTFNAGDFLHVGEITLQVTSPRIPCKTFAARMDDPQWVKKFRAAERPGLYCRVIQEGVVKSGDEVSVEKFTGETVSILDMYREFYLKERSEAMIRRQLASPIDIRSRIGLEKELQLLLTRTGSKA